MENNENIENLIDDAPPVANQQINNLSQNKGNNEISEGNKDNFQININNKKEDNNYSLFSSFPNINIINNPLNLQQNNINQSNSNNINNSQIPLNPLNNPIYYNRMIYLNRLNYLNYLNQINNKNNNINSNYNSIEPNYYNFKLDFEKNDLKLLKKEDLIYLIRLIKNTCKLFLYHENTKIRHNIFEIKKDKNMINCYLLYIKKRAIKNIIYKINNNNDDVKDEKEVNE